ncbi:hypothetical protein TNIN_337821 [Trichonephila inaurata madagascariensis]|uniref:Uncharacterized protein n=1 Tax=Trichonephila inaurata madagascariensis TaxID=2747483 RepID=A0A8X7BS08_9ARAC|nr:hypothetical protein TNIN_337821 [Trichonephila inaurata madagascariensis]
MKVEQLRGYRRSTWSSSTRSNLERPQHTENRVVKGRPPEIQNLFKRLPPSSLQEDKEVKSRPHETYKWRKRPSPQSLQSGPRTKRIPSRNNNQESWRFRVETSNAEFRYKPKALSGRSSPCPPRSTAGTTERQALSGRFSLCPRSSRAGIPERQALPERLSPYPLPSKAEATERQARPRRSSPFPLRSRAGTTERQAMPRNTSPYLTRSRAETKRKGEREKHQRAGGTDIEPISCAEEKMQPQLYLLRKRNDSLPCSNLTDVPTKASLHSPFPQPPISKVLRRVPKELPPQFAASVSLDEMKTLTASCFYDREYDCAVSS